MRKIICLFLLFFVGCATPTTRVCLPIGYGGPVASSKIILQVVKGSGIRTDKFIQVDNAYRIPTKDWVETTFSESLSIRIKDKEWLPESSDCDDFALIGHAVACELNGWGGDGIAFGEFYYWSSATRERHAINFFVYLEKEKLKLGFYEPIQKKIITLTMTEQISCYFWRL